MLWLDNVEAIYQNIVLALSEVNMRIEEGKIAVLLGNNGSGKSTTLKCISGVLAIEDGKLNTGKVELEGRRIDRLNPEQIARLGLCHVLQGHPVFDELTVEENLTMGAFLLNKANGLKSGLEQAYTYFPKLARLGKRKAGYLSGGEQQMLVIARGLMARPRIMLLDEPSLGLAPLVVGEIFEIIKKINLEQKTTFLIAEQNAFAVLPIADYGYILQTGKVALEGTAEILRTHQDVKKSYLGSVDQGLQNNYYSYIRGKRNQSK
jgi:branched-chain amino acid transport system ATP-binding protein